MKKIAIALFIVAAFVCGIAYAQVPLSWSKTDVATQFRIDAIHIVPYLKDCSAQYTFLNDKNEAVATKSIKLNCANFPGIVSAVKWVNAQIGIAEGKTIPDPQDVTK